MLQKAHAMNTASTFYSRGLLCQRVAAALNCEVMTEACKLQLQMLGLHC